MEALVAIENSTKEVGSESIDVQTVEVNKPRMVLTNQETG